MSGGPHLGDFFTNRQEPGLAGLPVMSVTMNDSLVYRDDLDLRIESALRPEQHLLVKKGDIAYNMMRMWQGACGLAMADGIVSPAYVVLVPKPGIDSRFAYHWFKSDRMIYLFWAYSHGLTEDRLRLYFDALAEIPVSPPSLEQQRRIVVVLDAWDQAIASLEALRVSNLRRRIYFRTKLLSGKTRLLHASRKWRDVQLGEILKEHGMRSSGGEPVFSVSVHKGLVNQMEHLGRRFAAKDTAHYNRVRPGDLVYTKSPTGEFPFGIVKQSNIKEDVIVSPLYGVFSPINRELGVILDAYFESSIAAKNYLTPLVQKGVKNTISIPNQRFLEGKLRLPMDTLEQANLATVMEVSKAEVSRIEDEIEALRRQKRGLMQKLLTAEWRLDKRFDPSALEPHSALAGGAA